MPHHSKHAAHRGYAQGQPPPPPPHSQLSFSSSASATELASHRMSIPSSMPTTAWSDPSDAPQSSLLAFHRVPVSPATTAALDGDATPHSVGRMSSIGTASSHASKDEDHDDSKSFESEAREVAASVLLLAAAAHEEQEEAERERAEGSKTTSTDPTNTTSITTGSRPMKKRKNHDTRRASSPEEGTAIQVSPLSREAPEKGIRSTSRVQSYEAKEETGESVPKESFSSSLESSPTRTVAIPHFPSALHWLLTEAPAHLDVPEFALVHTVLHFLPHGQAFKIARWDALRREVIPNFFPQLEGVDDFLWLLTSWGFEEIKDGPDVGAYAHTNFRRGHPQLCRQMRFEPVDENSSSPRPPIFQGIANSARDSDSAGSYPRSILRVPSLASTSGSTDARTFGNEESPLEKRNVRSNSSVATDGSATSPMHGPFASQGAAGWAASPSSVRSMNGPPSYVKYRPDESHVGAEMWHQYSNNNTNKPSVQSSSSWGSRHPPTPPPPLSGMRAHGMPPYSPIRIRSARGARRISLPASASQDSLVAPPPPPARGCYPVSNRGMGRRNLANAGLCRKNEMPLVEELEMLRQENNKHNNNRDPSASSVPSKEESEATHAPPETEERRSSMMMKRKLPLTMNNTGGGSD